MNISGDLTISEFKTQTQTNPTPSLSNVGAAIGKNSFLDLMKSLQGSAQKGLDETLNGVLKPSSKTEADSPNNETAEIAESKETETAAVKEEIPSGEENASSETEDAEALEEATNVTALPWFLVAEAKPNETVDPEIEAVIVDELQNQIAAETAIETQEIGTPSENETVETYFVMETESGNPKEAAFIKESSTLFEETNEPSPLSEISKEIKRPNLKKEETSRNEEVVDSSDSKTAIRSLLADEEIKESKLGEKKSSGKETQFKGSDEIKTEISREAVLDSEKWKISRDKKSDSYLALKTAAREDIKTVVLQQFGDSSSGRSSSGQEQFSRSGNGDSYSSLIKGNTLSGTAIRETAAPLRTETGEGKGFSALSRKDVEKNFQSLIRSARVQILGEGKTVASIRMNPKDLGHMSLSISADKDVIRGKLLVESDFVKQQLGAELANLRQELKASGLELESLVIEVREREETFAFNTESDKNGRDSRSFFSAFDAERNPDFKSTFYEDEEFFSEENSSDPNPFSEKTERKNEKLLDLKV